MFLAPDGAEIEIADTAAKFLSRAIPLRRLHGADASPALNASARADFASLGWFGLVVPNADGGSALSAVEHALFYREVGRRCGPIGHPRAGACRARGGRPAPARGIAPHWHSSPRPGNRRNAEPRDR